MRRARGAALCVILGALTIVTAACAREVPVARPGATTRSCAPRVWTAPPRDSSHVASFGYARCSEQEHLLVAPSTRDATADELLAFKRAHEAEWFAGGAIASSGLGACCASGEPASMCIRIDAAVCEASVEEIAWKISDSLRADAHARATTIRVSVALVGMPGPRCDGGETCGPLEYSNRHEQPPELETERTAMPGYGGRGQCAHDGECIVGGCGNSCVPWTESYGVGTCELRGDLEDARALCGCVSGACVWFTR